MTKLLVIDDDRLVLATLSSGLRKAGYEVREAHDGESGIGVCADYEPDLALIDIRMPGMSGLETASRIFHEYAVPFIMFTAYSDKDLVSSATNAGALGYLVKPLDVMQVIPTVEAALTRAKELRHLQSQEQHLNRALEQGRETSVAIGLLMERYRLSQQEAFELLRSYARSNRIKMADIAKEFVDATESINRPRHELSKLAEKIVANKAGSKASI
jgi:response regulator NasT